MAGQGATIKAKSALLESNVSQATEKILNVDKEISDLVNKQLNENGAKNTAAKTKLGLAVTNLNLASSANSGLIENMLSLTQGPAAGPGVFGLLGF